MIFLAIPTYDHKIHWTTVSGIASTAHYCAKKNIGFTVDVIAGDAFVGKARNLLVHRFLKSGFRDFIFVDADVGFDIAGIHKLCAAEPPIVMGLYQMKMPPPSKYPALLHDPIIRHPSDPSLIKLQYGPTGFMRIRREVFEAMIKKWPDNYYKDHGDEKIYDLFPHGVFDNHFIGEDIQFCNRVHELGFDIWAAQNIKLNHSGHTAWDSEWAIDIAQISEAAA